MEFTEALQLERVEGVRILRYTRVNQEELPSEAYSVIDDDCIIGFK